MVVTIVSPTWNLVLLIMSLMDISEGIMWFKVNDTCF